MKSKLGIKIGFLACLCYLVGQFFGVVPLTLLTGYILLKEESDFVKISAIKAMLIVLFVYVLNALIGLLPDCFTFIDWFTRIFGADTSFNSLKAVAKIDQILDFIIWIIGFCKKVVMLFLAFLACGMKTIKVPVVDGLIEKYVTKEA